MSGEILCDECLDTGWLEDREGRVVCSCVGETEPYQQMQAENERLREVLDEVVKRLVPLTPVILAAMQAKREGE